MFHVNLQVNIDNQHFIFVSVIVQLFKALKSNIILYVFHASQYCVLFNKYSKLLEFRVSVIQRSKRSASKARKVNNEPIIYAQWDISRPLLLSLQTAELWRVCFQLLMLMVMMRVMVEMTPARASLSTQACSSAPASTQTEYICTPRYCRLCVCVRLIVHIGILARLSS